MTTTAPAVPPAAPVKVLYQGPVAIGQIDVVSNIRKTFNEAALAELTASIRDHGVDQPVLLRPGEKSGRYALVDGERRYRAAKAAGLAEIPALVKDLTAEQALVAQAISFLQRDGLGPIEEARGFQLLMKGGKDGAVMYTVDQIAARLRKGVSYVYRAVGLLELPAAALDAIEAGTLTPAHGHQLLRVPPFDREKLLKEVTHAGYDGRIMPASELRDHINEQMGSDLSAAKFPKDKPYAGMDACNGCPSNSVNQRALFDEAVKGTCTNGACFATKTKQLKADFLDKIKLAHLGAAFVEYAKASYVFAGMMRTGGYVVREELTAKNAKGLYGVIIAPDQHLWKAVQQAEKAAPAAAPETDWNRRHAGNRAALAAEVAAVLGALKKKELSKDAKRVALDHLLEDLDAETVVAAWGDPKKKAPLEVSAEMFRKLVYVAAIKQHEGIDPRAVKFLGIDLKKIRAAAQKAAYAEYDAAKLAEKAPKAGEESAS